MEHRDLLAGFVRLAILHHAAKGEVYGRWMIEALGRHGYKLRAGTLYPLLHMMERRGYLVSSRQGIGRTFRRVYRATPYGRDALAVALARMRERVGEVAPDAETSGARPQ